MVNAEKHLNGKPITGITLKSHVGAEKVSLYVEYKLTYSMQDQIQEHKFASFEEICPDLSELIANHGYLEVRKHIYVTKDGKTRNIMDSMNCIVGEAHSVNL